MKCPVCNKEMILKGKNNSFNFQTDPKKKYKRSFYWCEKDDVWVNVEIPTSNK